MSSEAHHRHHPVHDNDDEEVLDPLLSSMGGVVHSYQQQSQVGGNNIMTPQQKQQQQQQAKVKGHPVTVAKRHMSMEDTELYQSQRSTTTANKQKHCYRATVSIMRNNLFWALFAVVLLISFILFHLLTVNNNNNVPIDGGSVSSTTFIDVEDGEEHLLDIDDENNLKIWFRTWGNPLGIPLLFVHGGPGNNIAHYYVFGNGNQRFFASPDKKSSLFWIVEVDQRGTGNSQPSVSDDWNNMKYYDDISIDKICEDFEMIRKYLKINQWLVWGGSFGSTISINYGEKYPNSCLGLILRGLYLDTSEEVTTIYSRNTYINNPKRLYEFDILFDYAKKYVDEKQKQIKEEDEEDNNNNNNNTIVEPPLDPNDAERILRVYAEMITNGDKYATWHWFVFENNLMEIEKENLLDPNHITPEAHEHFPEALSVSFFETRLWLHGSFERPLSNLEDEDKMKRLTMPIFICQGQLDEVCPAQYAQRFAYQLEKLAKSPLIVTRFLNATHEDTDPIIEQCLKRSLREFVEYQTHDENL